MALSKINPDSSCVFRQTFNKVSEVTEKEVTVTGVLNVLEEVYNTSSQNQKITYNDTNIGNFGTAPFSARIITKINSFTNVGNSINVMVSKGNLFTNGFGISIINNTNTVRVICGTVSFDVTYSLDSTKYYDFLLTRNGTTARLYINEVDVGGSTQAGIAVTSSGASFILSGTSLTTQYIKQSVKLVELYNKALGADEVKAIYNNSKAKNYNPIMDISKWIKGTGVYTETYQTTADAIVPIGKKIFTCGTAGTLYYPSKWAYGTVEFSVLKGADANQFDIYPISDRLGAYNTFLGYLLRFSTAELLLLARSSGGSATTLFNTVASYLAINTWYRFRITRTLSGVISIYVKGGAFTSFTLISTAGGSGTSPTTDNTYTTSNFFVIDNDTGDQISDIRFYNTIKI